MNEPFLSELCRVVHASFYIDYLNIVYIYMYLAVKMVFGSEWVERH